MVDILANGGYLHCTDKEVSVNSSLKGTKKMARVISKTQVSYPGPSWPSCFVKSPLKVTDEIHKRRPRLFLRRSRNTFYIRFTTLFLGRPQSFFSV